MTTTQAKIASAASQNAQLLSSIAEVDYAATALRQQSRYLADLQTQITATDALLRKLHTQMLSEQRDHVKYRDSTMRRFAYKVGGKKEEFQAKAAKEEKEYFDALQEEFRAKGRQETLGQNLEEAKRTRGELETASKKHKALQAELDALYNSIFSGPTPDFPEEDQSEEGVRNAQVFYDQIQAQLNLEDQTVSILTEASSKLKTAMREMSNALQSSQMDLWGIGGSFADFAERSALSRAQAQVDLAQMLISQANRLHPAVQGMGPLQVAQGDIMRDVFFDNIFTDLAFHDKIKRSDAEIRISAGKLGAQIHAATERRSGVREELRQARVKLDKARLQLQSVRSEMFERVAGGGGGGAGGGADGVAPPPGPPPPPTVTLNDDDAPPPFSRSDPAAAAGQAVGTASEEAPPPYTPANA